MFILREMAQEAKIWLNDYLGRRRTWVILLATLAEISSKDARTTRDLSGGLE